MKLDIYQNARTNRVTQEVGLEELMHWIEMPVVAQCISRFRSGDAEAKRRLPAVTYMGKATAGMRRAEEMRPTGLVMIDIDHADDRLPALIDAVTRPQFICEVAPAFIHITPSGKGLRIVAPLQDGSIAEAQRTIVERYGLDEYGDFDTACKDLSRLSFLPQKEDVVYINGERLFGDYTPHFPSEGEEEPTSKESSPSAVDYSGFKYGDTPVRQIAEEYVAWKGTPEEGMRHNFYNQMVLDFRNICNNSPQILIDVLPLIGASREERLSQCQSLCRRQVNTKIPRDFWVFLKERGYWTDPRLAAEDAKDDAAEDANTYAEEYALLERMPTLPPVFREYVNAAPREFKIPTLFALLPVMGTLATYLRAQYYDGEIHTPSFFTIIYAPAGSGKSFINRFLELDVARSGPANLMHEIVRRDYVDNARINLWNEFANNKSGNDRGKSRPKTSVRLMEVITSQADMLPVMKDNQGMHMFCFAPEIDTLIKGMRAGGGGDKNDIFRVAWDNGTYGQSYRNSVSFRGKVALYLNVLATGTPAQCSKLFSDIENGLVTRCSFTDLGQQEFAEYQPWKTLSAKDLKVIENFRLRCDAATYDRSLAFDLDTLDDYDDEELFDTEVPWQYTFRGRQTIDLGFMNKALLRWLEQQRILAQKDADYARDVFRKRAAGKAFRVALLCHACWNKVTKREQQIIERFALWFADLDIMKSLKRWGREYNDFRAKQLEGESLGTTSAYSTLYDAVGETFTKGDLRVLCSKKQINSPIRHIIYRWRKAGLVEKDGGMWRKVSKK